MRVIRAIVGGVAILISASAPLWAKAEEKITNDKVHVVEYTLSKGENSSFAPQHASVFVVLGGERAELGFADGTKRSVDLKPGLTVAEPAAWNALSNSGNAPIDLVRIEFLTAGLNETWGKTGISPQYKVLLEDRYNRTYEIRIPAHSFEPQHTHHDRVVVCLQGATLEHIMPDGSKQKATLKTGEVGWRLGQTHTGHNYGDTNLWCIAVEPK